MKISPDGANISSNGRHRRDSVDHAHGGSRVDRFRNMVPARDKIIDTIKTLFWVVPLTLIIWIYAEQEQVLPTPATVSDVPITLMTSDGRFVIDSDTNTPIVPVMLKLTGPQQAVRAVTDDLTTKVPRGLKIYVPNLPDGNNQPINALDAIQDQDEFRRHGVTVKEVQPAELNVSVDKMDHRSLTVQAPPGLTNLTDVKFEPKTVTVNGPHTLLERLMSENALKAYASLEDIDQLKKPAQYNNLNVQVKLSPAQPSLTIDPVQVMASITVMKSDVTTTIDTIPIVVQVPPAMMGDYQCSITGGESVNQVTVSGPQDKIDELKNHTFVPQAVLEIKLEDATSAGTSKTLRYVLPPNVKVSDQDARKLVDFSLHHRD